MENHRSKIIFNILLVVLFLGLLSANSVKSQTGYLKGKVINKDTKETIPFANVIVQNNKKTEGTVTDLDGNYSLKFVPAGKYNIKVSCVGYKSIKIKGVAFKPLDTIILNIKMQATVKALEYYEILNREEPLISKDQWISTISSSKSIDVMEREPVKENSKNINPDNIKSGQLTASELNDFSKWNLWQDIEENDLKEFRKLWQISPVSRYSVQVISKDSKVVTDALVVLKNANGEILWSNRTDNTGKAELWINLFDDNKKENLELLLEYQNKEYRFGKPHLFKDGVNVFNIPAVCNIPNQIDIAFVVDATGSMSDEIAFLQTDLIDIIQGTKSTFPEMSLSLGSVFYKCLGNSYVTKTSPLSSNIENTINFIKNQKADGGGDEMVEEALQSAVDSLNWSDNARARLLFFVMDEQPLAKPDVINKMQIYTQKAAAKGIKIIPIIASAETMSNAYSMEYLMRSIALATNGTYVFLTDHSKIGDAHAKPTTDQYDVELLNNLIKRLIYQFCYIPKCNAEIDADGISDTTIITNSPVIAHEIIDTSRNIKEDSAKIIVKVFPSAPDQDTVIKKPTEEVLDSEPNPSAIAQKFEIKFYPNPTSGKITVEIKGKVNEIYLTDISGKLINKYNSAYESQLEIDLSGYCTGIYFIKFYDNFKWYSGKIILTH